MTTGQLLQRNLTYFWRTNLAVVAGVAIAVSVLAGALLVGDSVRGSLRDLFLQRLGNTDQVITSTVSSVSSSPPTFRIMNSSLPAGLPRPRRSSHLKAQSLTKPASALAQAFASTGLMRDSGSSTGARIGRRSIGRSWSARLWLVSWAAAQGMLCCCECRSLRRFRSNRCTARRKTWVARCA